MTEAMERALREANDALQEIVIALLPEVPAMETEQQSVDRASEIAVSMRDRIRALLARRDGVSA